MHGRHCAPLAMTFFPRRHRLLNSRAGSKRLLRAVLPSVRGQSNFPANHVQFLTLLRDLESCGPSSFAYGSASSCPSSAFVVDCLQLTPISFTLNSSWLQSWAKVWVVPVNEAAHQEMHRRVTVPELDPRETESVLQWLQGRAGEKSQGAETAQEGLSRSKDVWTHHHPRTSVNTGSAAAAHCSIPSRNTGPCEGVLELTRCCNIWLLGVNVAVLLFPSHLAAVASPRFTHAPPNNIFLYILTPFISKKNAECSWRLYRNVDLLPIKAMKLTHLYTWPAVTAERPAKVAFF